MNNQEAQFILRAYRPQGQDARDPHFAAALEQARLDPALGQWFAREQAFDSAIAQRLGTVEPPAHLRASILAGARASRSSRWWRLGIPLAVAASLTVLLTLALFLRPGRTPILTADRFAGLAAHDVAYTHATLTHPAPGRAAEWLSTSTAPLLAGLPFSLDGLRADGCRTARLGGIEVFEICFDRGGGYHLFIARRSSVGSPPADVEFAEEAGIATARWSDAHHVYVLASRAGTAALRGIL